VDRIGSAQAVREPPKVKGAASRWEMTQQQAVRHAMRHGMVRTRGKENRPPPTMEEKKII